MKKKINFIYGLIFSLWVVFVLFIYFFQLDKVSGDCNINQACLSLFDHQYRISLLASHHYYYDALITNFGFYKGLTHFSGPILYIVGGLLFLYLANLLYEIIIEKKKSLFVNMPPVGYFVLFSLIFLLINNRWVSYFALEAPVKFQGIYYKYFVLMSQLFIVLFIVITIGKKIKDWLIKDKQEDSLGLIYSFGFGSAFVILLSYFLAMLGLFKFWYLITIFILLLGICFHEVYYWIRKIFIEKVEFKSKYFDPVIFLFIFIILIISHNLLDLFRPIPMGFDDLGVYMNNANLMANYGHLTTGAMSYYWELFSAIGIALYKDVTVALLLTFSVGIFSIVAVYNVTKRYLTSRGLEKLLVRKYSVLCAAIFYSLPVIMFQSSKDMKVDIAGMYFSLLALIAFWQWRDRYLKNKKASNYLFISAIFAGFSIAIKYTNILFVGIMLFYLAYIIFKKHRFAYRKYLLISSFLVICLLPVLPISIRNIYQTKSFAVADIRFGKNDTGKIVLDPPLLNNTDFDSNFDSYMTKHETGSREEVQRYLGYENGIKKYLLLPYRLITNQLTQGLYVDMGYLFLLFLPIGFIFVLKKNKKPYKYDYYKELVMISAIFWLVWAFSSSGIIWYGISGFIFILLLTTEAIIALSKINYIKYISGLSILLWLLCTLFIKSTTLPGYGIGVDLDNLRFARGEINKEMYIENRFKPYMEIIKDINKEIIAHPENPPRVYKIGTFYRFFITNNDKTVIDDQMLDKFSFAFQDKDDEKMLERLKNNNIRYFIIDRNLIGTDSTPEKSYLKKTANLLGFFERNADHFILLSDQRDTKSLIIEYR